MYTRSRHPRHPAQSGVAYVATLGVIMIATIVGLAFLAAVGTQTAISEGRNGAMQSQYLAESAVHHALWRFQNEPGFPAAGDVYYMEDVPMGRYGYKMRAPTPTTFATVATVGVVGEHVARQSYVSYVQPRNVLLAYGQLADSVPDYRRLFGANWSELGNTVDIFSAPLHQLELEGCPIRKEALMGTLDSSGNIRFAVWDGITWGSEDWFASGIWMDTRVFDIAYESQSGNALVVGGADGNPRAYFNYWTGAAWKYGISQFAFNHSGWEALTYVDADSCPKNDGILIATVCWDYDLTVHYWDGSGFWSLGVFDSDTNTEGTGCCQVVHEQQSGEAMVLWNQWKDTSVQFAVVKDGATLGFGQLPAFGSDIRVIRAAADPTSDRILVVAVLATNELHAALWDGSAWVDSTLLEPNVEWDDRYSFDVAWESTSGDAMIAWVPSVGPSVPRYITWQKGTALADGVLTAAPDCLSADVRLLKLFPISDSDNLALLASNRDDELRYALWTGSAFQGTEAFHLADNIASDWAMPFDLCEPMLGGAPVVPGPLENKAPVVEAGENQRITLGEFVSLHGSTLDDGLPSPPASVTTTWSLASGPGPAIFDDASLAHTVARVSRAGEYVFRLTASDGELSSSDALTVVVVAYVESFESWNVTADEVWTVVDLSGPPYDVPPNAVLEVAVCNSEESVSHRIGVRAFGSGLERIGRLHESEAGGVDALVLHVQADADSRIECFAQEHNQAEFVLLGYWLQGTYVEAWSPFQAGANALWRDRALAPYGVGPGQVAEILAANTSMSRERTVSVRTPGSTASPRAPDLQEAEGSGGDFATLLVTAGSDPAATVELWAEVDGTVTFTLAGYWSDPPGTFVEAGEDLGVVSAGASWESLSLSSLGVPPNAVVHIGLSNQEDGAENPIGVRQSGSGRERVLNLHEAESGGEDFATMHVLTDSAASIEWYQQDVWAAHRFYLYGWWE